MLITNRFLLFRGIRSSVQGLIWETALRNPLNIPVELYEIIKKRACKGKPGIQGFKMFALIAISQCRNIWEGRTPLSFSIYCVLSQVRLIFMPQEAAASTRSGIYWSHFYISDLMWATAKECCSWQLWFCNLWSFCTRVLHKSCFLPFYTFQDPDVCIYLDVHSRLFADQLPALHLHFVNDGVHPNMNKVEWAMSLYSCALPLDIVHSIWDISVFDGYVAVFAPHLESWSCCSQYFLRWTSKRKPQHWLTSQLMVRTVMFCFKEYAWWKVSRRRNLRRFIENTESNTPQILEVRGLCDENQESCRCTWYYSTMYRVFKCELMPYDTEWDPQFNRE